MAHEITRGTIQLSKSNLNVEFEKEHVCVMGEWDEPQFDYDEFAVKTKIAQNIPEEFYSEYLNKLDELVQWAREKRRTKAESARRAIKQANMKKAQGDS